MRVVIKSNDSFFLFAKFQRANFIAKTNFFQLSFNYICFRNCRREFFRSESAAEFLPPTPSFRPARADFRNLEKLRQQFFSKWVRATFRISHHMKLVRH